MTEQTIEQLREELETRSHYWFKKALALEKQEAELAQELMQARAELAQAQVDKELAQQGHLIASQEVVDLRAELAQTQIECNVLATTLTDANELHATVRDELAQAQGRLATPDQKCAYCGYKCSAGTNAENFAVMAEHIKSCPKHPLAKALAELAQARTELKSLQGARHKCERRLAAAKDSRDYWHETSLSAEAERDKACKEAQAQSDLVQREWLSPCQKAGLEALAEGLRRQLAGMEAGRDFWRREYERNDKRLATVAEEAAIVEAAEVLLEQPFIEVGQDIQQAVGVGNAKIELRRAIQYKSDAAAQLLERLATLDDAEAALANCGLTGIYDEFDGIVDAIQQMVKRLVQLEGGSGLRAAEEQLADARRVARLWFRRAHEPMVEVEITGKEMVEALQTEVRKRRVAEKRTAEWKGAWEHCSRIRDESGKTIMQMEQRAEHAEHDAHTLSKALDEQAQTAHTERELRQVAETSERASRKMLARQCDMARDAEAKAMEAKRCHKAALALAQNRATRLEKAEQRAECAEAELEEVRDWLAIQKQGRHGDRDKLLGRTAMLDTVEAALAAERARRQEAEAKAGNREAQLTLEVGRSNSLRHAYHLVEQRAERAEALVELVTLSKKMPGERAEALAALVTEETADLLIRLGTAWTATLPDDGDMALALAAQTREALDDKQA